MNPTGLKKSPSKTSQNQSQFPYKTRIENEESGSIGRPPSQGSIPPLFDGGGGDEDDENEDELDADGNPKGETTALQQRKCLGLNCAVWVLILSFMISIVVIIGIFMLFFYVVNPLEPDSSYNVLTKPCNQTNATGC